MSKYLLSSVENVILAVQDLKSLDGKLVFADLNDILTEEFRKDNQISTVNEIMEEFGNAIHAKRKKRLPA